MSDSRTIIWTVVEESEAGTSVIGVFSSLDDARAAVATVAGERLAEFRIEGHTLDAGAPPALPWVVQLTRDGEHLGTAPFISCSSCGDDLTQFARQNYIAADGSWISLVVFAATRGGALATARAHRAQLLAEDRWTAGPLALHPSVAEPLFA